MLRQLSSRLRPSLSLSLRPPCSTLLRQKAGSRFEDKALRGVSHIMDRVAFKSTSMHSADAMLERVEALGGNIQCASSRESMMYQAATFNGAVRETVGLLAETIRDPRITAGEVAEQIETARYEIAEIWGKPDLILPELVHTDAFKDNTLGNPLLCPEDLLACIDRRTLLAYRDLLYKPERTVLAFAGVEHAEAVALAERFFGDMESAPTADAAAAPSPTGSETTDADMSSASSLASPSSSSPAFSPASSPSSSPSSHPSRLLFKAPLKNISTSTSRSAAVIDTPASALELDQQLRQPAHYTGGFLSLPARLPSLNHHKTNFTHIHLAFEGLPVGSDDIYALATLQTLLGGGGSFSAGGPGKGMFSRLYTNVLNQHAWVESCVAFNHSYTDSGLFGISASCLPGHTSGMLDVMCQELQALTLRSGFRRLQEGEVTCAKNQLRSSLLMNFESRMVELEDLGRSVQVHGRKVPVRDMCRRIEALTVVVQEAQAYGVTSRAMTWDQIQDRIDSWQLGRGA